MLTTWLTHEEAVPKMPCGRRKLNASCKRTRYDGLRIFVVYLETVKVLPGPNFFKCVCVYMSAYHIHTEIYS